MTVHQLPHKSGAPIPPRDQRDWVTTEELLHDARITYRQADYWTRTNLLVTLDGNTPGSGYLRRFHEDQIIRAFVIRNLLDIGLSLQTVRACVDQFIATGRINLGPFTLTSTGGDAA